MSQWTDELRERVKSLWTTHSALSISALLKQEGFNFSRNAVIGLLSRMKLSAKDKTEEHKQSRSHGVRRPLARKREPKTRSGEHHAILRIVDGGNGSRRIIRSTELVEIAPLRCVEVIPLNLTLEHVDDRGCRYIPGNDLLYCGHPQRDGSSFCAPHHALCYQPAKPPSRSKHFYGAAA